jgi:F-type H+-transporting ATPase subunit b
MNINATLILNSIAMMIFVWFCMKFIWPPLLKALDERREKIADGLAASDRAEKALEEANARAEEQLKVARDKAGEILDQAAQRRNQIVDDAKEEATAERHRQVSAAEADITQAANQAREELRSAVAGLAVAGAARILEREVDENTHRELLDKLIAEI